MTNEEAKVFLDNLKICIDEHPIVADWLVEIADRKTEPQTIRCPKCGRSDYIREFGKDFSVTAEEAGFKYKCINCNTYIEPQSDRKTEPSNSEIPNNSTISKMEQVDKDINVRSKDEPQACEECEHWNDTEDGCADRHGCKTEPTISKMEQVDEPQIYKINPKEPTNMSKCFDCEDFFTCDGQCDEVETEPQTEDEILREQCRAFMGIVEQTKRGE